MLCVAPKVGCAVLRFYGVRPSQTQVSNNRADSRYLTNGPLLHPRKKICNNSFHRNISGRGRRPVYPRHFVQALSCARVCEQGCDLENAFSPSGILLWRAVTSCNGRNRAKRNHTFQYCGNSRKRCFLRCAASQRRCRSTPIRCAVSLADRGRHLSGAYL